MTKKELINMFVTTVSNHDVGNIVIVTMLPSLTKSESISIEVELDVQEGEVVENVVEDVVGNEVARCGVERDVLENTTVANDPLNVVVLFGSDAVEIVDNFELEVEVGIEDVGVDACFVELLVAVL